MIRIGIIGCGRILAAHLRGYRLLREAGIDDFQITALCSSRPQDARMYLQRGSGPPQRPAVSQIAGDPLAIGDEYLSDFQPGVDVEIYSDYRQLITAAPVDAINDFTTHALHHQIAEVALAQGKHLLTQKPMAVTVAAARRMCEQAERAGVVLGVFENFHFLPNSRHLSWWFQHGHGGHVQLVLIGFVGAWWAPDRIVAHTSWRHLRREGGGISLDLGVHFFDQVRQAVGEIGTVSAETALLEPKRFRRDEHGQVIASIDCDADDTCQASFSTINGAQGTLAATWAGHGAPTTFGDGLVYYGTAGRVMGDSLQLDNSPRSLSLAELYGQHAPPALQSRDFPHGLTDSFALAQLDWLTAVRHSRPPEMNGWQGLIDLAAAYSLLESSLAGRRVAVADVLSGQIDAFQAPINRHFGLV
jgi:predicted dehydrogenase